MRTFVAALIVAVVLLSALVDRGVSPRREISGWVSEFHAGEWMVVRNVGARVPVSLGASTRYEGNPSAITPGLRVTVWYRMVGERRPVADKVRMIGDEVPLR